VKREINPFDYAGEICKAMPKGILLTTKAGEKVNTMTIGWGTLGIEWSRPVFVAYVRESRHTRAMLDGCSFCRVS
jgi:flavin reductase (DIM6/NTAB) family NADH-FMN oxidoreductase RutF